VGQGAVDLVVQVASAPAVSVAATQKVANVPSARVVPIERELVKR
jgi:hypothetical protein